MQGTNGEEVIAGSTRRQAIMGVAMAFGGLVLGTSQARAEAEPEVSHVAELIHQEPTFKASRKRVYEALTDATQFQKIILLSAAMKTMSLTNLPAQISTEPGGAFALFGGYITGRQVELVPDQRIVQAWRAGSWDPSFYSIADFTLVEQGSGTKIIFEHRGFPKGLGEHLLAGWKGNYWEPLAKFLA
jgi:activator of HSP90 ATPase